MRRAAKVDANQGPIVQAALSLGCSVQHLSKVGNGCPDLLIGQAHKGGRRNLLVEVKNADGRDTMEPAQIRFHREWRGQVAVVRTVQDLLDLLKK